MSTQYTWQEIKRQANLLKHKLDFMDADWVLESPYRLDIETERNGQHRQQSFAYVFDTHGVDRGLLARQHSPYHQLSSC